MKIAFLILAHGDPKQLNVFIRQLLKYRESYVYIHLDSKAGDMDKSIIQDSRVFVLPERFCVNWGDYSIVEATKYLISYAHDTQHHDYYSLHSGVDMAIRPVSEFAEFLEKDRKFFYASFASLPVEGWQYGGGRGRIALKWPKMFRQKVSEHSPIRYMRGLYGRLYNVKPVQKIFPLNKNYDFYGGSEWFTVSSECIDDTLKFLDEHKDYDKMFRNSISSDEIYFNTVFEAVRNGREAETDNHLMYINWDDIGQKHIGGPNVCTMGQLQKIEESEIYFARKMDASVDGEIISYFEEKC